MRCGLHHCSTEVKYELFAVLHLTHWNLSDSGCAAGADVKHLLLDSQALSAYEHILTYKTPGNLMLLLTAPTDINCNGETDSCPQQSRPVFSFLYEHKTVEYINSSKEQERSNAYWVGRLFFNHVYDIKIISDFVYTKHVFSFVNWIP